MSSIETNASKSASDERLESKSPINVIQLSKLLKLSNPNLKKTQSQSTINDANDDLEIDEPIDHSISALLTPQSSPNAPAQANSNSNKRIHRVVLTGGPCAGKTTSINKIKNFFENIGWKVFCVPETATILLSSGIYFYDLGKHTIDFQENLLKTLLQIEDSINQAAKHYYTEKDQNVIIIYDRGAMDPVAYLDEEDWEILKQRNSAWNEVDLRDNRYDQIIHLITAAKGAEQFYTLDNNLTRTEGLDLARQLDAKIAKAWIGHPYKYVIDNCTDFEIKIARVLQAVCDRIGLQFKGFDVGNRKRKFLVKAVPDATEFPPFQDFNVVHNYLASNSPKVQARIRKRGQSNIWSYTYTVRFIRNDQVVETYRQIDKREYAMLYKTIDSNHFTIYKLRRCFEWKHRYYQLDMYEEPCNPSCRGLIILTTRCMDEDLLLPDFLQIEKDITKDPNYSMFTLSKKKK
ncbi:TRPL translocation defect 14 isoform X3 [Brachionus plicatilis]|uniref:TRPL translocation defect 14 isoform X3 n=1 Tax=Brachionus plicatilis TaxID=10195 RepID=A0A3M7RWP7_BRAPC|nr:TRPL translocation defect 14 isoform X3 [Brachionus plicatilis]